MITESTGLRGTAMGFVDPLFISSVFGIIGIIGAYNLGIPANWLYSEVLFTLGNLYLLWRDWNIYGKRVEQKKITGFKAYYLYFCISTILMILALSAGMTGDSRLGTSALRKIIDIISAIIFPAAIFSYQMVNRFIPKKQRYILTAGLLSPILLGSAKSSSIFTLSWAMQRWINPKSDFFAFQQIANFKLKLVPIIAVTVLLVLILFTLKKIILEQDLLSLIAYLSLRFTRDLDFYIFASQVDNTTHSQIFEQSGGWLGNILGNLSGYTHNIGALVKAAALNTDPDATGSNPRILGLIITQIKNTELALAASIFIVCIELWIMSEKRKQMGNAEVENTASVYGFIIWTTTIVNLHKDVGTLKYSIIAMLSGYLITLTKTKTDLR